MIIGHKKQWEYLAKAVKQGKIPQALLFSGEQNLGKKFVALKPGNYIESIARRTK